MSKYFVFDRRPFKTLYRLFARSRQLNPEVCVVSGMEVTLEKTDLNLSKSSPSLVYMHNGLREARNGAQHGAKSWGRVMLRSRPLEQEVRISKQVVLGVHYCAQEVRTS